MNILVQQYQEQLKCYNQMNKSYIYLLFLIALVQSQQASEGTQGFYISPHGITRQREVHDALEKIAPKLTVARTTYYIAGINYAVDNFTVKYAYNDGKQTIDIPGVDQVLVSGGRIQIQYTFNFSKIESGKTTNGWATGSVLSDSLNYTKMLTFSNDGHLFWCLATGEKSFTDLKISTLMKIKRMEPYNQTDYLALQDILDRATASITPSNVEKQILQKFNTLMPITLNTTLNSYILGPEIMYEYNHPVKGKLSMTIIHHLYGFGISPDDGYKVIFLTEIKDWPEPVCNGLNVPSKHLNWDFYGGSQNIHLICLYQEVIQFMQKKGWLDVKLDTDWDCNAFQFYAGDLYDMINNLYLNVNPRQLLEGQCKASPDKLSIKHGRQTRHNILAMDVTYNCTVRTRDKSYKYIDVLNFIADVKLSIQPKAQKTTLDFTIVQVEALNMQFKPVGQYYVGNINLALFKTNQILHKLIGTNVFGSGFPSLAREFPGTEVNENYTVYYDLSHKATPSFAEALEI